MGSKVRKSSRNRKLAVLAVLALGLGWVGHLAIAKNGIGGGGGTNPGGQIQLPTTLEDFHQPGTQPQSSDFDPIITALACVNCHAEYLLDEDTYEEPWDGWTNSMMGQSARDPVWYAALAIANQDANMSGEYCIRCHSPGAWLSDRSTPPDASAFENNGLQNDFEGVVCHFCHRMVNPVLEPDSPPEDVDILADLPEPPGMMRGNGRYVVDPNDVRRGPFEDIANDPDMNMHGVPVIYSPFHQKSELCATCHDVMNPAFMRQPNGTYELTGYDEPHPTQDPYNMFPEQATYSEWKYSAFAKGGVYFPDGRFGGNHINNPAFIKQGTAGLMQSCQDCHMPDKFTGGCFAYEYDPWYPRQDMPEHTFAGANHWVLRAVRELYGEAETGLSEESIAAAEARAADMLRAASDVQVVQYGNQLKVRVINYSGHKLPTGYPEGRRMWINVRFYDSKQTLTAERGAYDGATAELTESDTKVYRAHHGIDDAVAAATGLPNGAANHLALNNMIFFDNRIPPIGFTNADYELFGSAPVGHSYADGQYWDDTSFTLPKNAATAVVTLYYQSMTKEYIEFLRDANVTNSDGQTIYDLWADPLVGNKAVPVDMDMIGLELGASTLGDIDADGDVDFDDFTLLLASWGDCESPNLCAADLDMDGDIDFDDFVTLLANWG